MVAVGEVGTGRQAVRVAGVQGRVAKELLVKEGEGLMPSFWGLLKSLDLVGMAGGLSRLVGEEEEVEAKLEEEERGGEEWGSLLLLDVEGVLTRLSAGEVERLQGEEGGG